MSDQNISFCLDMKFLFFFRDFLFLKNLHSIVLTRIFFFNQYNFGVGTLTNNRYSIERVLIQYFFSVHILLYYLSKYLFVFRIF